MRGTLDRILQWCKGCGRVRYLFNISVNATLSVLEAVGNPCLVLNGKWSCSNVTTVIC